MPTIAEMTVIARKPATVEKPAFSKDQQQHLKGCKEYRDISMSSDISNTMIASNSMSQLQQEGVWTPATTWTASYSRDVNNSGDQDDIKLYIFGKFLQTNGAVNFSIKLRFFAKLYEIRGFPALQVRFLPKCYH